MDKNVPVWDKYFNILDFLNLLLLGVKRNARWLDSLSNLYCTTNWEWTICKLASSFEIYLWTESFNMPAGWNFKNLPEYWKFESLVAGWKLENQPTSFKFESKPVDCMFEGHPAGWKFEYMPLSGNFKIFLLDGSLKHACWLEVSKSTRWLEVKQIPTCWILTIFLLAVSLEICPLAACLKETKLMTKI